MSLQFLTNGMAASEDWRTLSDDDRRKIWQAVRRTSRNDDSIRRAQQNEAGAPQLTHLG
jgi:hypothetical protein